MLNLKNIVIYYLLLIVCLETYTISKLKGNSPFNIVTRLNNNKKEYKSYLILKYQNKGFCSNPNSSITNSYIISENNKKNSLGYTVSWKPINEELFNNFDKNNKYIKIEITSNKPIKINNLPNSNINNILISSLDNDKDNSCDYYFLKIK